MKRVLIIELWGLGDATLMSSVLQGLISTDWDVTILAKPQTRILLHYTYPTIRLLEFDAPWTVFLGKYKFAKWPWSKIFRVLRQIRRLKIDAAISVRSDPRDHLLMWLGGIRQRIGFYTPWSWLLLKDRIFRDPDAHRVEDWWTLQDRLNRDSKPHFPPRLVPDAALTQRFQSRLKSKSLRVIVVHCGAKIPVRRWPEAYWRQLILDLQRKFEFQLVLIPDPDGYGSSLQDLADHTFVQLDLPELQALLSCADQLICNDSGPSHIAAALQVPVIVFFGPQRPALFRPYGQNHFVVVRDICPFRPCSDYCRLPEPYCLSKLTPDIAGPEVESQLLALGRIPVKNDGPLAARACHSNTASQQQSM